MRVHRAEEAEPGGTFLQRCSGDLGCSQHFSLLGRDSAVSGVWGILGGLWGDSTAVSGVPGVFEGSGRWCKEFLGGHGFSPNPALLLALGLISAKEEKHIWEGPGV